MNKAEWFEIAEFVENLAVAPLTLLRCQYRYRDDNQSANLAYATLCGRQFVKNSVSPCPTSVVPIHRLRSIHYCATKSAATLAMVFKNRKDQAPSNQKPMPESHDTRWVTGSCLFENETQCRAQFAALQLCTLGASSRFLRGPQRWIIMSEEFAMCLHEAPVNKRLFMFPISVLPTFLSISLSPVPLLHRNMKREFRDLVYRRSFYKTYIYG